MRALIPAGVLLALLAAVAPPVTPRPVPVGPPPPDPIEQGLKLVAARYDGGPVLPRDRITCGLTLVNTSRHTTYRVVKPGDGSEVGWREPHVFFTATRTRADGGEEPVPRSRYARCGLFDADWARDVVEVPPGGRLSLDGHWAFLEFQQPGRVRLVGHYAYRAGRGIRAADPDRLGRMRDVPPFELVSAPVEFEVVRPLDVRVRVKRAMKAMEKHRLADLLDIEVVNPTAEPAGLATPGGYPWPRLRIDQEGTFGGWRPTYQNMRNGNRDLYLGDCSGIGDALPPGGRVSLLGPDRLDGDWTCPVAETLRVRAAFYPGVGDWKTEVKSDWVEVRVEP